MNLFLAAGDAPGAELLPYIFALIVFIVAFIVLAKVVWPKITSGLDARDQKIRDEIQAAEDAREQASAAQAEYESSLKTARQEASEMINKAKADAKAAADDLRQRNDVDLADMKQRATRDIESAKQAAITELHQEATTLAAAIAGKILQREISLDDQQRLIDESLKELEPTR